MKEIIAFLGEHWAHIDTAAILFSLMVTRWLLFTLMIPFLGAQLLPPLVRVALALLLAMVNYVYLDNQLVMFTSLPGALLVLLFIKEALIGFTLGLLVSLIFYAYEMFGQLADLARAANMAQLLVPEVRHQSSTLGTFLFQLSLVTFLALGLHRQVIETLFFSFEALPVAHLTGFDQNALSLVFGILSVLLKTALGFALPIIFVGFLIDLAFGLLNRVAPQINAYFLSLPAKMVGGLVMLLLMLPFIIDDFFTYHQEFMGFITTYINQP